MIATVLILTGLPGCGKTTASDFFRKNNIPVFRMGDLTDEYLAKSGFLQTSDNECKIRNDLRKRFGEAIYAIKTVCQIEKDEWEKKIIVIEGMKSEVEFEYFLNKLNDIRIIYIKSRKEIRYKRLLKRKIRSLTRIQAELRDKEEIIHYSIQNLIKKADFIINNNRRIEDLNNILNKILKKYD